MQTKRDMRQVPKQGLTKVAVVLKERLLGPTKKAVVQRQVQIKKGEGW